MLTTTLKFLVYMKVGYITYDVMLLEGRVFCSGLPQSCYATVCLECAGDTADLNLCAKLVTRKALKHFLSSFHHLLYLVFKSETTVSPEKNKSMKTNQ